MRDLVVTENIAPAWRGGRLFDEASWNTPVRLVETRPFRSGVVLLWYRTDAEQRAS